VAHQPPVGQGLLIIMGSQSHSRHTLAHSRRTPLDGWSVQRKDLYLTPQHSQETDIHDSGRIRTHNPSKRTAADPRLRPRGHWDRPKFLNTVRIRSWVVGQYWYVSLVGRTVNSVCVKIKVLKNRCLKAYRWRHQSQALSDLWQGTLPQVP
jgi:hypothetical protein